MIQVKAWISQLKQRETQAITICFYRKINIIQTVHMGVKMKAT
jgi:hypothetical protein